MAFAPSLRSPDEPTLPGELPFGLRRLHRREDLADRVSPCRSLHSSPRTDIVPVCNQVVPHDAQGIQELEAEGDARDLFKVADKLEDIIERLTSSCKLKPDINACMDTERTVNLRDMEERLEKVICKMSQAGYLSRCSNEHYRTPSKENCTADESESLSTVYPEARGPVRRSPKAQHEGESNCAARPHSSFKLPLLTPRSLLSKLGASEKTDAMDSCTKTTRRQSSGGRANRLSSALSFLYSPKRTGIVSSSGLGSS